MLDHRPPDELLLSGSRPSPAFGPTGWASSPLQMIPFSLNKWSMSFTPDNYPTIHEEFGLFILITFPMHLKGLLHESFYPVRFSHLPTQT
jgi:hypothetical protein